MPRMNTGLRIGQGIDFHRLVEGRELWIGGVQIPHYKGALGHSDADVLLHAICDGLLGSLSLGDIGTHFPDTDPAYKGIDSKILLQRTIELLNKHGYAVINIDATICLQLPKVKPFVQLMRENIASILRIGIDDVSIKATTTEQLGFIGREEGLMATANVLVAPTGHQI
jgi:2-C-methyl-D-erythritol 2,4-cyclodiphosphate synthase